MGPPQLRSSTLLLLRLGLQPITRGGDRQEVGGCRDGIF
uniref:Uncharacterized protein n=1 Tax=Arundo donax TaxID=35708 RepID=A0A0A9GPK3_ARUDO